MTTINFINPLEMLKRIVNNRMIDRDKFVIVVTGRVGPTGKTWLCQELRKLGYHASELSPMSDREAYNFISVKDDGFNRMTIDADNGLVMVVLNETLPMYRNKGFGKPFDENEGIYTFETRLRAECVLTNLRNLASRYGVVTRADYMDCVGKRPCGCGLDYKLGWTEYDIQKARVLRYRDRWMIEFPKSKFLG